MITVRARGIGLEPEGNVIIVRSVTEQDGNRIGASGKIFSGRVLLAFYLNPAPACCAQRIFRKRYGKPNFALYVYPIVDKLP